MPPKPITILWLRQDLRLTDNAALHWAAARGPILPIYIIDTHKASSFPPGAASKWWLYEALKNLDENFKKLGVTLIVRKGHPKEVLNDLIQASSATAVTWCRCYEAYERRLEIEIEKGLVNQNIEVKSHNGFLLFDPEKIKTGGGTPFKVYTPFSRACFAAEPPGKIIPAPMVLKGVKGIESDAPKDWHLVPRTALWPKGLAENWDVGEKAAHKQLNNFITNALPFYKNGRDRPDKDHTSRLSPYLHFGHISPRQVWHAIQFSFDKTPSLSQHVERYLLEILWREFSWYLLYHLPQLPLEPLNKSFATFPWRQDTKSLKAWQQGLTGYPIVDAGMRQLWQTGWMHNRVRMIAASFLIKDLLIDWREGAAWFWDTLVDADLGSNTAGWQWVAGCGADASPYFRIFNPTLQGEKFDIDGDYVRRYLPELAKLDKKFIHQPWKTSVADLAKAGVVLGKTYPYPLIDHGKARERALSALKQTKGSGLQPPEIKDLFE